MTVLRTIIFLALLMLAVFVLANWSVLTAQTTLSLLVFTVEAPLGLILLGVILFFLLLFSGHAASVRTSMLLESRRHAQELKAQRDLADQSESSRLTELRQLVERRLDELRTEVKASDAARGAALVAAEQSLRNTIDQATNMLAASIGELEDKVSQSLRARGPADRTVD